MSDAMGIVIRSVEFRCPDCDLRNALTILGEPKRSVFGYDRTYGCEGCGGGGLAGQKYLVEVEGALAVLTAKQRFVMERRLGYTGGRGYTLKAIGKMCGISKQAVHKSETGALKKLARLVDAKEIRLGGLAEMG